MSKPTYSRTVINVRGKDQEVFEVYADESRELPVGICFTEEAARRTIAGMRLTEAMIAAAEQDTTPDLLAKVIRLENEKAALREALERLSSGEGFIAIGMIPDGQWGDEIKARREFAQDVIDKATS